MDMPAALRARILASADVRRLVAQRVYWMQRAQATALPAIVLQTISDVRGQHMRGFQSLRSTRVRADVWAGGSDGYAAARQVSEAVIAAVVAEHRANGIHFRRAQIEGPRDLLEDGQTAPIFRCSTDLLLWWSSY